MSNLDNYVLFGIEQELFILREDCNVPTCEDIDFLYASLMKVGYSIFIENENKQTIAISFTTLFGDVIISNEIFTHIIEITFPPFAYISDFSSIYEKTINDLSNSIRKSNLVFYHKSILEKPIENYIYRTTAETKKRIEFLSIPFNNKYSIKTYSAQISSTQIHLNILNHKFYENLKYYYHFEYLFPLFYSTSKKHGTVKAHCLRPLVYRDNLRKDFFIDPFPKSISMKKEEYYFMLRSHENIRDYSFISPRPSLRTVEFRISDTQFDIELVKEIISLRIIIHKLVSNGAKPKKMNSADLFYKVCETGYIDIQRLNEDFGLINNQLKNEDSSDLVYYTTNVLNKIQSYINLKQHSYD